MERDDCRARGDYPRQVPKDSVKTSARVAGSMWYGVDLSAPPAGSMARRGVVALIGFALQGASRFLALFLVGRFTSPAVLALVASAVSVANLLSLTWPTSTGGAASRFIARARGQGEDGNPQSIGRFLARRTLLAMGVLSLAAIPLWVALGGDWSGGMAVAVLVAGYSGFAFTRGVHLGSGQLDRQLKWDLTTSSAAIVMVLVVLISPLPEIAVLAAMGLCYTAYTLACWPWSASGEVERGVRSEIDRWTAWASLGTLASAGFVQFAMVTSTSVAGHGEAGMFAAAMTIAAPAALIANSFAMVLFPSMSEALGRGDTEAVRRQLDLSTRLLAAVTVPIFAALVIGARPLVHFVWGDAFLGAAPLIPLLLVPALIRGLAAPSQGAVTTSTGSGIVLASGLSLSGLALGAAFWAFMPSRWGVQGVAVGYALGTVMIASTLYVRAWQQHAQRWTGLSVELALAVGAMSGLAAMLESHGGPMWLDLCVALAFVVVWAARHRSQAGQVLGHVRRSSGPGGGLT